MLTPQDYTIVLFCPLVIEQRAACLVLDRVHAGIAERSIGQTVLYTFGEIASYNVAIAGYPAGEVGLGVSGSMVSEVLRDFPAIEFGLLVGIGAGIPSLHRDIRLGDVAVAVPSDNNPGVIGYDLVKVEEGEVRLKQWLNSTHPLLRSVITSIRVQECRPGLGFAGHIPVADNAAEFKRPAGPSVSLEAQGLGVRNLERNEPQAHYGTILSGNGVIKSKKKRDELRDKYGGIAIEMEAAGMMVKLPIAVIRGISDFADASKNDKWHAYAALAAAAYAKEMIVRLGPLKDAASASHSLLATNLDSQLSLSMPEQCDFVGRETELARIEAWLDSKPRNLSKKVIIAIWGLGGIGKSQLVAEVLRRQKEKNGSHAFFWLDAESQEALERSIIALLKAGKRAIMDPDVSDGHQEQRQSLVESFFAALRGTNRGQWTLVFDNLDPEVAVERKFMEHVHGLPCGSIIIVSRSRVIAQRYHNRMEIKGLRESDAVRLLQKETNEFQAEEEGFRQLGNMLNGHPLSLKLAASNMSFNLVSVSEHIERWKNKDGFFPADDNDNLLRSLDISFDKLSQTHPIATKLLMLFSFLDHNDMWYDLCLNGAPDSGAPEWLRQVLPRRQFHDILSQLHNLSFIEVKINENSTERKYEIHPAIHDFARWKARNDEEQYVRCAISLVAASVPRSNVHGFLEVIQRLEPHAEQCMIHLRRGRAGRGLDLFELEKFGNLWRYLGRLEEAARLYEGILNVALSEKTPDKATVELIAGVENNLGLVCHVQRKYEHALQLYQTSFNRMCLRATEGPVAAQITHYNIGRSLMMLGKLEEAMGVFHQAEAYFSKLLRANGSLPHQDGQTPIYCRILNDIGEVHLRMNDLEGAERYFKIAFDGLTESLHELHPLTFAVRLNIGRTCIERSRYTTANNIFSFIIETYSIWWGRRSSETMRAVAELATSHMRHGEARQLMGDGGEAQFAVAAELWTEVLMFHQEMYGFISDVDTVAGTNLKKLRVLSAAPEEDPYSRYFS